MTVKPTLRLLALVLLGGCASGQKPTAHTEAIESHVYPRPLDEVLAEATTLLGQKGWHVERVGEQLGTNWRLDASGTALGYRVEGERIDEDHCRIRIEALAASSFAPSTGRSGGSSSVDTQSFTGSASGGAGGKSTGWDGVDAPTTLGEPPPGMVTLPRGREDALEYTLLQRLEPRAAEAIAHADARAPAAAPLATPDAGTSVPAVSLPGCEPTPTGAEAPLVERRLLLLADVPGTKEIPDFVGRLACQAARQGIPTVVALELLHADQEWVDTYLASRGSPGDQAAFLQVARSFDAQGFGGRGSVAVLQLLDRLRILRDAGLSLRVVAFDETALVPGRGKVRAATVERVRRTEPDALLLVVVERSEARTVLGPEASADKAPLGFYLAQWGLKPLALDVRSPGGNTWACPAAARGQCGTVSVPALGPPPAASAPVIELYPAPDAQGFGGDYAVGTLSASAAAR